MQLFSFFTTVIPKPQRDPLSYSSDWRISENLKTRFFEVRIKPMLVLSLTGSLPPSLVASYGGHDRGVGMTVWFHSLSPLTQPHMSEIIRPKITAIIPAYNEEQTVAAVVRIAHQSDLIDDVLVVSDGSTDNTVDVARAAGARILALSKNHGKGAAMRLGVLDTNAPIILFLDADLLGLTVDHLEKLILPVVTGARVMNVGQRDRGDFINTWVKRLPLPLISGERAVRRDIFLEIPEEYIQGFMVENALNYKCRVKKFRYGSVLMPGLSIRRKYQKVGWKIGLKQYVRMTFQIIKAILVVRIARVFKQF